MDLREEGLRAVVCSGRGRTTRRGSCFRQSRPRELSVGEGRTDLRLCPMMTVHPDPGNSSARRSLHSTAGARQLVSSRDVRKRASRRGELTECEVSEGGEEGSGLEWVGGEKRGEVRFLDMVLVDGEDEERDLTMRC